MPDFFDKNFFQSIITGIILLVISLLLSRGKINSSAREKGKGWKIVVIVAWVMILGGIYMFIVNLPKGDFNNIYFNIGSCLIIFGNLLKYLGKFFIWWHR